MFILVGYLVNLCSNHAKKIWTTSENLFTSANLFSKLDVENKLASSLEELKRDVNVVQEKVSQDFTSKVNKFTYQFRIKGNEVQFSFNSSVEESISAAKQELAQLMPTGSDQQVVLKRAQMHLDEGAKAY